MELKVNQESVIPMVKAAIAGNKHRFIRLGIVAVANIVGGKLAGTVVDSLLERMWKNSQLAKQEAEFKRLTEEQAQERWMVRVLQKEIGAVLQEIVSRLDQIAGIQESQGYLLGGIVESIAKEGESGRRAIAELRERIDRLFESNMQVEDALEIKTESGKAVLHVMETEVRIPHYANFAEFLFSIHNFSRRHLKIGAIRLTDVTKTELDTVQLPREGQVNENFELSLDLRGSCEREYNLLKDVNVQFTLSPQEAEAFRLKVYCDDGYIYYGKLSSRLDNLTDNGSLETEHRELTITSPISNLKTLRTRRK